MLDTAAPRQCIAVFSIKTAIRTVETKNGRGNQKVSVYSRKYDNVGFKASKSSPLDEIALGAAFCLCLGSLFLVSLTQCNELVNLFNRWAYEDEYGYGFLATALVPVLLWTRWPLVKVLANDTKWPGLALVVIAQFGVLGALGKSSRRANRVRPNFTGPGDSYLWRRDISRLFHAASHSVY